MRSLTLDNLQPLLIVSEEDHDMSTGHLRFFPINELADGAKRLSDLGLNRCKLYVKTRNDLKNKKASQGLEKNCLMVRAVQEIMNSSPNMKVGTEVCACAYHSDGECVITNPNGIDNMATHQLVSEMAVLHADAGARTIVAGLTHPGSIAAIRDALDLNGHPNVSVIGSIQLRTGFYAPYRLMMGTEPEAGETFRSHLLPSADEAILAAAGQYVAEGASILSIQPALLGAPLISKIKSEVDVPIFAYSVSTELNLVRDRQEDLWLAKGKEAIFAEYFNMLIQSGADGIQTYVAKELATWLLDQDLLN